MGSCKRVSHAVDTVWALFHFRSKILNIFRSILALRNSKQNRYSVSFTTKKKKKKKRRKSTVRRTRTLITAPRREKPVEPTENYFAAAPE